MHHSITVDGKGTVGTICVEREAQTCIILFCDPDRLNDLAQIGKSLGAEEVQLIVPKALVEELRAIGWTVDGELRVMRK